MLNEALVSFLTRFPEPRTCCWETGRGREGSPGTAVLVVTPGSSSTSNPICRAGTMKGEAAPSLPSTRLPRPTLQPPAVLCWDVMLPTGISLGQPPGTEGAFWSEKAKGEEKATFRQGRSSSWSPAGRLLLHYNEMLMVSLALSMLEQGGPLPAQHRRASPAVPR